MVELSIPGSTFDSESPCMYVMKIQVCALKAPVLPSLSSTGPLWMRTPQRRGARTSVFSFKNLRVAASSIRTVGPYLTTMSLVARRRTRVLPCWNRSLPVASISSRPGNESSDAKISPSRSSPEWTSVLRDWMCLRQVIKIELYNGYRPPRKQEVDRLRAGWNTAK